MAVRYAILGDQLKSIGDGHRMHENVLTFLGQTVHTDANPLRILDRRTA